MKTETQREYERRILAVLVHIQGHLNQALDLEELAGVAHFSPFHFHRVFRGMVGEPVKEHVRRLRLERAAYQLKSTGRAVTEIAFDAGFETHEAFTRAFRSMFDDSPSGFRRIHRPIAMRRAPSGVHFSPEGEVEGFRFLEMEVNAMEVRIENAQPVRVAFRRHVGPYDQVGATWQSFMGWAFAHGLMKSMARPLGVLHDDPEVTPPSRLRYDVCLPVDEGFTPEGDVGVQVIDGGPYAVTVHRGAYEKLSATYAALLGQWLPAHDYEAGDGPCLECYLNNPQQTPADELVTEVHVPVRRAKVAA